jgi:putative methyltransferase (TIGR04325 family)
MKEFVKLLIPPLLVILIRKLQRNKNGWRGDYANWEDAQNDARGYDSDVIIQEVKKSLLKVKNGDAIYERDSVVFEEIQYSWQLLAGLMFGVALPVASGRVKVLDFGGSLGSTYYQNKKFLDKFRDVSWSIVEQKHFVDVGKKHFEDERLKFFNTVEECLDKENPSILILSSVLQYIEEPFKLLDVLFESGFQTILIDRTPFSKGREKITLQTIPSSIYEASYPCWFFDEAKFITYVERKNYSIVESFMTAEGENKEYIFKGFILKNNV